MRTRRVPSWAGVALVAAFAAGACNKEPDATPPKPGGVPSQRTATVVITPPVKTPPGTPPATGPKEAPPRAQRPLAVELPPAAPLTEESARKVLSEALGISAQGDLARAALLALAATSDAETVRTAAARFLAKGDGAGGFDDPDVAATALEALLRAGDAGSAKRAVDLARDAIEKGEIFDSYAPMLAAVTGPAEADARKLLVRLADDPDAYEAAIRALAPLREKAAATRLHDIATDAEQTADLRATAAAGLLALGDPRAEAVLTALVHATEGTATLNSFDVMDGLAVEGVADALPWTRKIADPIVAEDDNSDIEIRSLVGAYVAVRGAGNGTKEDIESIRKLLGKSHGIVDDEIIAALWALGDDTQSDATANLLAARVKDMSTRVVNEDQGVFLLDAIAARHAAGSPVFGTVVNAAAAVQIPKDTTRQDAPERAWRLRVAAARAFLAAKKR